MANKKISLFHNRVQRILLFALFSSVICFIYALYNGILGITLKSIWHGSICIYYLLLLITKISLIIFGIKLKNKDITIFLTYLLLLIITIAMITPVILLVKNQRTYNLGLIPAIAMAAYTTYSVSIATININKMKKQNNYYIRLICLINMITALMSITVLQHSLIVANNGYSKAMITLSAWSNGAIIILTIFLIVRSFLKYIKCRKETDFK